MRTQRTAESGSAAIDAPASQAARPFGGGGGDAAVLRDDDVDVVLPQQGPFTRHREGAPIEQHLYPGRERHQNLTYEPVACPDEIRGALVRFLAGFGLNFGTFDFAVTADGAWWFLECNPNGQWAWLEDVAGLSITTAVADLLENGASQHD